MKNTRKTFEELKPKLARSLKEHLIQDCKTPEGEKHISCDLYIPYHHIVKDRDEEGVAYAVVGYSVDWIKEQKHSVHIKFNYEPTGKCLQETITYV